MAQRILHRNYTFSLPWGYLKLVSGLFIQCLSWCCWFLLLMHDEGIEPSMTCPCALRVANQHDTSKEGRCTTSHHMSSCSLTPGDFSPRPLRPANDDKSCVIKKDIGGVEPPTTHLTDECSATELYVQNLSMLSYMSRNYRSLLICAQIFTA